jgi:hypothetical protein
VPALDHGQESGVAGHEAGGEGRLVAVIQRPQKITFAEVRASGVHGLLVLCADYHRSHSIATSGDQRLDEIRLSDIEARFVCGA